MVVYLDLVILLNFTVNFLLLHSASRLAGHNAQTVRCLLAAALGGAYAAICTLFGFHFLGGPVFQILVLFFMCLVAYGLQFHALKQGVLFYFLSMSLAGIATGMHARSFLAIILSGVGVGILCFIGFSGRNSKQQYVPVELHYAGKRKRVTALVDSGNLLTDPLTGNGVLVAGPEIAMQMLGLSHRELSDPIAAVTAHQDTRLRLIPYRAVGQSGGMLLAATFDKVIISGEEGSRTVAFSPYGFGPNAMFQALTGG